MEGGGRRELRHRRRRHYTAVEKKRLYCLLLSWCLILMGLFLVKMNINLFKRPFFITLAFLNPAAQNFLAIVFFSDIIRDIVEDPFFLLQVAFWVQAVTMFAFTVMAEASVMVSFSILCFYMVWAAVFEFGLDLATNFHLTGIYTCLAAAYAVWFG